MQENNTILSQVINHFAKAVTAGVLPFVIMGVTVFLNFIGSNTIVDPTRLENWIYATVLAVLNYGAVWVTKQKPRPKDMKKLNFTRDEADSLVLAITRASANTNPSEPPVH